MFEIEYKGGSTVVLSTKNTTVVADPKTSLVGLKDTNTKDAIELGTEVRFLVNNPDAKLVIEGPGEYEIGDFSLSGVPAQRHIDTEDQEKLATVYRIGVGEVHIALLGNIAPKLTEDELEAIGVIDILVLPVGGGGYTLDATSAATIVRQIEPKVVIPVHYADSALTYEVPQDTLDTFTKELGAPVEEGGSKYKVKSAGAIPQSLTVITLARS
ncbi:Zn-dependent hydrolase [Candidatus Mycosynbacter amalyticus]|uniref:Zn-dependent hydrolase n=2 Tax=Candidatus Mycosynbacter amalyticus TaxID=2665156 RepID=A0A857MQM0_9BACT|nr:Zn-dependent hydrolase [Candidatus Mycosynbacter amalyticus]